MNLLLLKFTTISIRSKENCLKYIIPIYILNEVAGNSEQNFHNDENCLPAIFFDWVDPIPRRLSLRNKTFRSGRAPWLLRLSAKRQNFV